MATKKAAKKSSISPEGRQRIASAQKARWAAKKAATKKSAATPKADDSVNISGAEKHVLRGATLADIASAATRIHKVCDFVEGIEKSERGPEPSGNIGVEQLAAQVSVMSGRLAATAEGISRGLLGLPASEPLTPGAGTEGPLKDRARAAIANLERIHDALVAIQEYLGLE
jgi:hypothetical protein